MKTNHRFKKNWLIKKISSHQTITFTFFFLFFYRFFSSLILYFNNKQEFIEEFHFDVWLLIIFLPIIYFLQWLLVIWVASKFTKETLKIRFFRHPILTIIFFVIYIVDLPLRLKDYSLIYFVPTFETIMYYAFVSFFWWLLACWISSKVFKKNQETNWSWYKKIIDKVFDLAPTIYKITLGLIVSLILFTLIIYLFASIFQYSGEDLRILNIL